jgi:hypothetical protein
MDDLKSKYFTKEKGLEIQRINLRHWKKILNRITYDKVLSMLVIENGKLEVNATGYDVFRGDRIGDYIHNLNKRLDGSMEEIIINRANQLWEQGASMGSGYDEDNLMTTLNEALVFFVMEDDVLSDELAGVDLYDLLTLINDK